MEFQLPTKEKTFPGENWFWSIYPFPNDWEHSIRVNLLIDTTKHPPEYAAPYIEISDIHILGPVDLRAVRTALDQAELKVMQWADKGGERV